MMVVVTTLLLFATGAQHTTLLQPDDLEDDKFEHSMDVESEKKERRRRNKQCRRQCMYAGSSELKCSTAPS